MLKQYKELHDSILEEAAKVLAKVQKTEDGYVYNLGYETIMTFPQPIEDINFIATMIRTTLALKTFGENHEGFVL